MAHYNTPSVAAPPLSCGGPQRPPPAPLFSRTLTVPSVSFVSFRRHALFELHLDEGALVRRGLGADGHLEHALLVRGPRVLEDAALVGRVEQVLVDGVLRLGLGGREQEGAARGIIIV